MILKSNYDKIDFNELYKEQKSKSSFGKKLVKDWDKKAPSFNEAVLKSQYVKDFISKIDFNEADSLLDFACGAGALSVAAASKVKQIYGYDFSPKMLEFAIQNAKDFGLTNVKFAQKAFEDDWSDVPECDIVFASRCLEVDDIKPILTKLLSKTKCTLYITFKVGGSFVDEDILEVIERDVEQKPDFVYLVNILFQMGYLPTIDYIKSICSSGAPQSAEELIRKTEWSLGNDLNQDEILKLKDYFNSNNSCRSQQSMDWAFIRVDV
ncbi:MULTISPECIES: methyltransferase domain-containing protein [unclassified Campylobacter]|uniref:class I SAM-dependent methyltransferase n=1 Tax=unclassified Campylobacter TaxID=2593542 RepID=UPI00147323D6|nr:MULTISPECIES: methyltransferase domain-containing protein [unclassified Campylobacter]